MSPEGEYYRKVQTSHSHINPDGSAVTIISNLKIPVSKEVLIQSKNECTVIQRYMDRGSVDGNEIPEEKLLSPLILERAKNRAKFFIHEDEIKKASEKPKLIDRIRNIFHR